MKPRVPITTAGLYWLLVLCGLVGTTILRRNHPDTLVPLWIGTVLGVSLGQLATVLRIRPILPILLVPATAWIVLPFSFYFFQAWGASANDASILALSFFPSLLGGYLSLSERGGLVAFWYPVVLWMIVILEHPLDGRQTAFHPQAALPFLVLLGALFVAFLRARETRRVAIWQEHGSPRLATKTRRTILRSSPMRAALSVAWTGAVGGVALLLTWWVAPQLWQRDQQLQREEHAQIAHAGSGSGPCCGSRSTRRTHIHEYLPILGAADESGSDCRPCSGSSTASEEWSSGGGSSSYAEGNPGFGTYAADTDAAPVTGSPVAAAVEPAHVAEVPVTAAPNPQAWTGSTEVPPAPYVAGASPPRPTSPHVARADRRTDSRPVPGARVFGSSGVADDAAFTPGPVAMFEPSRHSPFPSSAPWPWMFGAAIAGVLGHVLLRMLRRTVTLAHLARPFWKEPVDQRISNHWQRMLIGLRDAGIQEGRDESPGAFARRIGIEGMASCAMILERVRHGVRIEEHDLANMASGASAVFTAARRRAGMSGRTAAWLRWPLA